MTTAPEQMQDQSEDWGNEEGDTAYPEYHTSLSNHLFTWSPKLPDGSMLVIRANSADALVSAARAASTVADQLMKAWNGTVTAPPPPAPMAPAQQYPQAQQRPNQPYQGQPAWQTVGAPQGAFPQAPAAPQGGNGGNRGPKPRPDWPQVYKITVPFQAKDAFKAFREQNQEHLKGKVAWAGGGNYWIHGDVVQGFSTYTPVPA